jgi:hypothetical protein
LGVWLGGALVVTVGAPQSFRAIDSVMLVPPPEAAKVIQNIGPVTTRLLLRYQIAEANRLLITLWGWIQLAMGVAVLLLVLFGTSSGRLAIGFALALLIVALVTNFILAPRLGDISRDLEFTPGATTQKDTDRFQLLHRGFAAFEAAAALLGAGLFITLLRSDRRRDHASTAAAQAVD